MKCKFFINALTKHFRLLQKFILLRHQLVQLLLFLSQLIRNGNDGSIEFWVLRWRNWRKFFFCRYMKIAYRVLIVWYRETSLSTDRRFRCRIFLKKKCEKSPGKISTFNSSCTSSALCSDARAVSS